MKNETLNWGKTYLSRTKNNIFEEEILAFRHPEHEDEPVTLGYGDEEISKVDNTYGPKSKLPLENIPPLKGPKIIQVGWDTLSLIPNPNFTFTKDTNYIGVSIGKDGLVTEVTHREEDVGELGGFTINWRYINNKPDTVAGLYLEDMYSFGLPFTTTTKLSYSANAYGDSHKPHPAKYWSLPLRFGELYTFIRNSRKYGLVGKRKYGISIRNPKDFPDDLNVPYEYQKGETMSPTMLGNSLHKDMLAGEKNLVLKPVGKRGDMSGVPEMFWLRSMKGTYPTKEELDGIKEIPNTSLPKRTLNSKALGEFYRVVVPVRFDQLTTKDVEEYEERRRLEGAF